MEIWQSWPIALSWKGRGPRKWVHGFESHFLLQNCDIMDYDQMIICICAKVSEGDILALLPAEPQEVMLKTNCAMNCGACFKDMLELIEKNRATENRGLSFNRNLRLTFLSPLYFVT